MSRLALNQQSEKKLFVALSPYSQKAYYPTLSHFMMELARRGHEVIFACPEIDQNALNLGIQHFKTWRLNLKKIHHAAYMISLFPLLARLIFLAISSRRSIILVGLGPLTCSVFVVFWLLGIRVKTVSYQPELHEQYFGILLVLHRWISNRVDLFLDVSEARLQVRAKHFGIRPKASSTLPNEALYFPEVGIKDYETTDREIHFVYGGGISEAKALGNFFRAFEACRSPHMFLHVYLLHHVGRAAQRSVLVEEFADNKSIIWHSELPLEQFADEITKYQVGVCIYPWKKRGKNGPDYEDLNSKFAAPSKVFGYLASGLLVLTGRHPTLEALFERGLAIPLDYDDLVSTLKNSIDRILPLCSQEAKMSRAGIARANFSTRSNWASALKMIEDL